MFFLELKVNDEVGSVENLEAGIDQLNALIDAVVATQKTWTFEEQTRGGIAAWRVGVDNAVGE